MTKPTTAYRPRIVMSVSDSAPGQLLGAIEVVLRVSVSDSIILEKHVIAGPECRHLHHEPNPADLRAVDRMTTRFRSVAKVLGIQFHLDKVALAELVWRDFPTA